MGELDRVPDEILELVEQAAGLDDRQSVEERYAEIFSKLDEAIAAAEPDAALLQDAALWLRHRMSMACYRLAAAARDFETARRDHALASDALSELAALLGRQAANGVAVDAFSAPQWYLAYRDELGARLAVRLLEDDALPPSEAEQEVLTKVRSAAARYGQLESLRDVADCYTVLESYYSAVDDAANVYAAATTAADLYRQAAEREGIDDELRRSLRISELEERVPASFVYVTSVLLPSFRIDEADQVLATGVEASRELGSLHAAQGDDDAARTMGNLTIIFESLSLYTQALTEMAAKGQMTEGALRAMSQAKARLAAVDQVRGQELYKVAASISIALEIEVHTTEMFKCLQDGDVKGAETSYDRAVSAFADARRLATSDEDRQILDLQEAVTKAMRRQVASEKALARFDFDAADQGWEESTAEVASCLARLGDAARIPAPLRSSAEGLASYCTARRAHGDATRLALSEEADVAIRSLEDAIRTYDAARATLIGADQRGQQLRNVCVQQREGAEALKHYLEDRGTASRARLIGNLELPDECKTGDRFTADVLLENVNDGDATDVRCSLELPPGCAVEAGGGFVLQDGAATWAGVVKGNSTLRLRPLVRVPDHPVTCEIAVTYAYGGVVERLTAAVRARRAVVEWDLGPLGHHTLSQAAVFWLKVVSYPTTLVLGAVIGALMSHLFG